MIILDATTKTLQIKLGATATNALPFSSSYIDSTGTSTNPLEQDGTIGNSTAINLVSNPGASTQRLVKSIAVQNANTAAATVTIIYNNTSGPTARNIIVVTLAVGDQLIYEDGQGWSCLDSNGNLKTSGSGGGGGAVSSVSNSDGTLTISPTTGSVVASLGSFAANTVLANASSSSAQPTGVALSASQLFGRGSTGNLAPIALGTNLSMSGATLNAAGSGGATLGANTFTGLQTLNPGAGAVAGYVSTGAWEEAVFNNGSSGTSKAINLDNGNLQSLSITGNVAVTQTTPSHPGKYTLIATIDSTGGRTYSLSGIKWVGGTAPTYSSAANKIDIFSIIYDGTNYYGMAGIAFS